MDEDQGKFKRTSSATRVPGKEEVNAEDADPKRRCQSRCLLEWQANLGIPVARNQARWPASSAKKSDRYSRGISDQEGCGKRSTELPIRPGRPRLGGLGADHDEGAGGSFLGARAGGQRE